VIDRAKLLQVKEVVEEINRHKWIQSEMVGYDIGFDKAADHWFQHYAAAWVTYHAPKTSAVKPVVKEAKKVGKK
jgi:hypothetical protein